MLSKQRFSYIICLLVVHSYSLPIITSPDRTASVEANCNGIDRYNMVSESERQKSNQISNYLSSYFKLDSIEIYQHVVKSEYQQAYQIAKKSKSLYLFILPFIIGFGIAATFWPFLLCCCICPNRCPPKCTNAKYNRRYYCCDLKFPILLIILTLGGSIAGCAYGNNPIKIGFNNSNKFDQILKNAKCGSSIVVDDFINGNATKNQQYYFAGLKTISSQIGKAVQSSKQINDTFNNISNSVNDLSNSITDTSNAMKTITTGDSIIQLNYSKPLNGVSTEQKISSLAPTVIGNTKSNNTLIGGVYFTMNQAYNLLQTIKNSANNFSNNAKNVFNQLTNIQSKIKDIINDIINNENSINQKYNDFQTLTNTLTKGFTIICVFIIIVSAVVIISAVLMNCCPSKDMFRYAMYGGCVPLYILCLLAFVITIILSILTPATMAGCWFINDSLNGADRFRQNFDVIVQNIDLKHYIMECLPTSDGNLVGQEIGTDAIKFINTTAEGFNSIAAFAQNNYSTAISQGYSSGGKTINMLITSQIVDITDEQSLAVLTQISSPNLYNCSANSFQNDKWVPSVNQVPQYIPCNLSEKATSTTCTSLASFISRDIGCRGCMDTSSLFFNNASSAQVRQNILNRYSNNLDCNQFADDLSNTWNNYYKVKTDTLTPILNRYNNLQPKIDNITNQINPINKLLQNAINTNLNIINSSNTLFLGTNCRLFGVNVQNFFDNFCTSAIPTLYISYISFSVMSFCLLVASCCIVCAGSRHYKHKQMELKDKKDKQTVESGQRLTSDKVIVNF